MRTLLTVLSFVFCISASAQQMSDKLAKFRSDPHYFEGYVIDLNNKKLNGLIKPKEKTISFVDSLGDEHKFRPSQIRYYYAANEGSEGVKYLAEGYYFFRVIDEGPKVGLYSRTVEANNRTYVYSFLKKPNEKLTICYDNKSFSKVVAEYFSDCKSLKTKIETKQLGYVNLYSIIQTYNNGCD